MVWFIPDVRRFAGQFPPVEARKSRADAQSPKSFPTGGLFSQPKIPWARRSDVTPSYERQKYVRVRDLVEIGTVTGCWVAPNGQIRDSRRDGASLSQSVPGAHTPGVISTHALSQGGRVDKSSPIHGFPTRRHRRADGSQSVCNPDGADSFGRLAMSPE